MAKCPECGYTQDWGKLFSLNNYNVIVCPGCGTQLQYNRKRYSEIIGVFFVIFMLPLTPFVEIEFGYLWILAISVPFCIAWVTLLKLERAETSDVAITESQKHDLEIYANKRRKLNSKLVLIIIIGMSIWFVDAFILNSALSEYALIVNLLVIFGALIRLMVTRCPYCNKLTPNMPRCGSCKRKIGIRQ